jgi:GNAT superfamily N-acetyltransferase
VTFDHGAVLAEYDAQVRRGTEPDGSGAVAERAGPVVRWKTAGGGGWSGIAWSDLDSGTADETIADQVGFFRDRGEEFEWKLYSYDRPADLGERLLAAGFTSEDEEAVMIAEAAGAAELAGGSPDPAGRGLPAGVRLVPVTDEAGVGRMIEVHDRVFGTDHSQLRASLIAQLAGSPQSTAMIVAMAGDEPVSSARIDFYPGTEFAGLFGGGTLPQWRGRGIYRALVAYRARLAAARGYRYLQVDASVESRPILERLGFACLAMTTPYTWSPG